MSAKVNNRPKYLLINEKIASICGTMSELVLTEQYSVRGNNSLTENSINTNLLTENSINCNSLTENLLNHYVNIKQQQTKRFTFRKFGCGSARHNNAACADACMERAKPRGNF